LPFQNGQPPAERHPQHVVIDGVVGVDDSVSHSNDLAKLRHTFDHRWIGSLGELKGFADELELAFNSPAWQPVPSVQSTTPSTVLPCGRVWQNCRGCWMGAGRTE
jgi:hypothetical protein